MKKYNQFKYVSNKARVKAEFEISKNKSLREIGELVQKTSKKIVPVDTGNLRKSIFYKIGYKYVELKAYASYAIFVEKGTRKMRAQPFLKPAFTRNTNKIKNIFRKNYKK